MAFFFCNRRHLYNKGRGESVNYTKRLTNGLKLALVTRAINLDNENLHKVCPSFCLFDKSLNIRLKCLNDHF